MPPRPRGSISSIFRWWTTAKSAIAAETRAPLWHHIPPPPYYRPGCRGAAGDSTRLGGQRATNHPREDPRRRHRAHLVEALGHVATGQWWSTRSGCQKYDEMVRGPTAFGAGVSTVPRVLEGPSTVRLLRLAPIWKLLRRARPCVACFFTPGEKRCRTGRYKCGRAIATTRRRAASAGSARPDLTLGTAHAREATRRRDAALNRRSMCRRRDGRATGDAALATRHQMMTIENE